MVIHQQVAFDKPETTFSCLEDDLAELSRWIEFSTDNESTCSIELAKTLDDCLRWKLTVVAKDICFAIAPQEQRQFYICVSVGACQKLCLHWSSQSSRTSESSGLTFQPWSNCPKREKSARLVDRLQQG